MNESVNRHKKFMEDLKNLILEYEDYRNANEKGEAILYSLERKTQDGGFVDVWASKMKGTKDIFITCVGTVRKHLIKEN